MEYDPLLTVKGTRSKKLIDYIGRVYDHLGLDAFVEVTLVKELRGGAQGYANGDEETVDIDIARTADGRRLSRERVMINIAHEMIHAQQYNHERMINEGISVKDGMLVSVVNWEGTQYIGTPYEEQPWELEAYTNEERVYEACK